MFKNRIKNLLHRLGIYRFSAGAIRKIYYPYKFAQVQRRAGKVLEELDTLLRENTQAYWLAYGTLLGFVRDGKIISGDMDIDIGIKPQEGISLSTLLKQKGARLLQETFVEEVVMLQQYRYRGIDFDLFYYYPTAEGKISTHIWFPHDYDQPQAVSYREGHGRLVETTFTDITTRPVHFLGAPFRAPVDADTMLAEHYGSGFMIPDPGWTHDEETSSVVVDKSFRIVFAS